jgi:hypothetical protein
LPRDRIEDLLTHVWDLPLAPSIDSLLALSRFS